MRSEVAHRIEWVRKMKFGSHQNARSNRCWSGYLKGKPEIRGATSGAAGSLGFSSLGLGLAFGFVEEGTRGEPAATPRLQIPGCWEYL